MLRAAFSFFILALIAYLLGANSIAGLSMEIAKILIGVFVILAIVTTVAHLVTGRSNKKIR